MQALSIASILRNNEDYLRDFLLPNLSELENSHPQLEFHYYFYENDSSDQTPALLREFLEGRKGLFKSESFGAPSHPRNLTKDRLQHVVNCRRKLMELRPFEGDWTLLLDSDTLFSPHLLNQFLEMALPEDCVALSCNGRDMVSCQSHPDCSHYYDVLAFKSTDGICGVQFHLENGPQCCPLSDPQEREKWFNSEYYEVQSAFGGLTFYRNRVFNDNSVNYELGPPEQFQYQGKEWNVYSDHWVLNKQLREHGKVYVAPKLLILNSESNWSTVS